VSHRNLPAVVDALVHLKELPRAGWKRVGIEDGESVADHSYGVALLALVACPPGLDRDRLVAMALLHDLAEAHVGDITPHDGVSRQEKHRRERAAMHTILHGAPDLLALWEEAEACTTPEARYLKRLDRAEMATQARRYAVTHGADVSEFLESAGDAADLFPKG
jgi:putative hydrolase of HD superfamily